MTTLAKQSNNSDVTPRSATRFIGGTTAVAAIGFGLLNIATGGLPVLALGVAAGAVALASNEKDQSPRTVQWVNNLELQKKYVGRNTANYLISTLEKVDAVIEHKMYKTSRWIVGTTSTGVPVMISSKGDFKVFRTEDEKLQMAMFFVNDLPFVEATQASVDFYNDKPTNKEPSVIDFIAEGQVDKVAHLPLGRLIRLDQKHLELNDYKIRNQSWRLLAMENGMFVAVRGSTNLTYRCFKDKDSFWRFYNKSISKEKRYFLPSEELGENLEQVTSIDEETDLIKCFLDDIVERAE